MNNDCRICRELGGGWVIGCSPYEFITPYPEFKELDEPDTNQEK